MTGQKVPGEPQQRQGELEFWEGQGSRQDLKPGREFLGTDPPNLSSFPMGIKAGVVPRTLPLGRAFQALEGGPGQPEG